MTKLLATLALSALVAAPTFAATPPPPAKKPAPPTEAQKEKSDKAHEKADEKGSAADQKKAHDEYVKAAAEDKNAIGFQKAADAGWKTWQENLHKMYQARANARGLRADAARLNAAASKLIHAERLRDQALDARLGADQLLKRAHNHSVSAGAAEITIKEGQRAIADLQGNPALANAINDIKADIAKQTKVRDENNAAAKADTDVANKLMAEATQWENQAAGLERNPVAPVKVVVKAPPPPVAIIAKAKGK